MKTGGLALNRSVQGKLVTFGFERPEIGQAGTFIAGDHLYFTDGQMDQELMSCNLIRLRGAHNMLNVLAASAIACAAGFPIKAIQAGVEGFNGVAHRMEYVRTWKGADWYNVSISTAPERTMADIHAFDEPLVLLLGGRDKDLPGEAGSPGAPARGSRYRIW